MSGYQSVGPAGMANNPISYIDPDGRNPILIGFMAAMMISSAMHMIKGTQPKNMWQFVSPGITGAIGGGLGSLAPIGVLPGMAFGAGSGAVTGGLGAAFNGGNIGRGAAYGAAGGALFGGISGGIQANKLGANIWSGYRAPRAMYSSGNFIDGRTSVEYGSESVNKLYNENFSDINMKGAFFTNKAKNVYPEVNGNLISNGQKAFAVTRPTIWKGGDYYKIYFGRNAFSSKEQLSFVLTHELGHVIHDRLGLSSLASEIASTGLLDTEGHVAIQAMTFDFLAKNGWNYNSFSSQAIPESFTGSRPDKLLLNPIKTLIRVIR